PFIRTGLFSWRGKMRMGAELFVPVRRDEAEESIAAFIGRRFGAEAVTYLAEPLLAGIHAGDVDRLSARAVFPRFVEAEQRHGSVIRGFRRGAVGSGRASMEPPRAAFMSLPGGLSEMVRALVAALPTRSVLVDTAVSSVAGDAGGFRVETAAGSFDARAVVFATPAYATAGLVAGIDAGLSQLCAQIPYASVATVALGFERSAVTHPLDGSGFVVPRVERVGILAASWLSSKWPHRAPEGRVLLRTFIGGARDPDALALTDEGLVDRSLRALTPILGIHAAPILARVYRFP